NPQSGGTFTDPRDGKTYRTVRIGNLTWMAQNLNFKTGNSWCYEDNESNCQKYGRLYDWNTAMSACPSGWRLPDNKDWNDLTKRAGGQLIELGDGDAYWSSVGKKLKSKTGWSDFLCNNEFKEALNKIGVDCVLGKMNSGNGTDNFGISALPGGDRYTNGSFSNAGDNGSWWSATEYGSGNAYYRSMFSYLGNVYENNNGKGNGLSVLCVQD
ncbi:MAG: fibrobacter succinogenes major paralogous domain-containing protein, partial [Chitinispirillia bacterium]|nr:fibrobacter succinogenes major paralogous domain-containing protein [Chitinispirillia bacterium]MCL2269571.1 fibrobacter succinogenes major paralogous domain-containing protein [Chitinispirillia bacterium]